MQNSAVGVLLNHRLSGFCTEDSREAVGDPLRVVVEADLLIEFQEMTIAVDDVESDAVLELPKADRAQVQGARIAFFQMVGAVHHALEVDAMPQAEHVGRLMGEDFAASS